MSKTNHRKYSRYILADFLARCAYDFHSVCHILLHGLVGQKPVVLKDYAYGTAEIGYFLASQVAHVYPVYGYGAFCGVLLFHNKLNDGGFSCGTAAYKEYKFTLFYSTGYIIKRRETVFVGL